MKKILYISLGFILAIGLVWALRPSSSTVIEENCIYGRGGVSQCYEEENMVYVGIQPVDAKVKLDTGKYPSYMIDAEGYYVSIDSIGKLFKEKYFGIQDMSYDDYYYINPYDTGITKFRFRLEGDLNVNDLFAKIVLMANEFANYGNYYINNSIVVFELYWEDTVGQPHRLIVYFGMQSLLNENFVVNPQGLFDGEFDNGYVYDNLVITQSEILTLYDNYIANGTYSGYVLNFN